MKNTSKISIVTPSFNQGEYIERTILSVVNQQFPCLEYIVIDGGSEDNTVEILQKYNDHLTWLSEPDNGQSDAINKGFRMATGEILAWINSDDTYILGAFQKISHYFEKNPTMHMLYGNGNLIDENDRVIGFFNSSVFDLKAALYHGRINIFQPSVFIRRSVFEEIGLFDHTLELTMDVDYWIRIAMKKLNMHYFNHTIANLRWHSMTKTSKNIGKHRIIHLSLLKKYGIIPFIYYFIRHILLINMKVKVLGKRKILKGNAINENGQHIYTHKK